MRKVVAAPLRSRFQVVFEVSKVRLRAKWLQLWAAVAFLLFVVAPAASQESEGPVFVPPPRAPIGPSQTDQDDDEQTFVIPERPPIGPSGVERLTLDETVQLGIKQNPSMVVARERIEQARANYEQQKSNKNFKLVLNNNTAIQPRRSIDTSPLLTERIPNFPERFVLVDPVTDQFTLSLQRLLTTFGKVENAISAAFLGISVQTANAEVQELQLAYDVKEAFFNKLKAEASVTAVRSDLAVSKENLGVTQALFERGIMARYDILQAEIQVTRSIENLSQSLTTVDQSSANLAQVLAENSFGVEPIAPDPIQVENNLDISSLRSFALAHRPEMVSLDYQQQVAEKLLLAAKGESKPEVVLAANYQTALGQSLAPTNVPSITLQIQWAIFDGGLRKAKVAEAESVIRELDAEKQQLQNQIQNEVDNYWLSFLQSAFSLQTAEEQLKNTIEYHEMALERYRYGLATTLEVSDALRNLVAARSALIEAQYDRDLAFARLERALGENVPDRNLTQAFLNQPRRPLEE